MTTALLIFAKAPVAGLAKTRLAPALGADGAAALAERLLEHCVAQAASAGFDHIELCTAPDASHPAFRRLAERFGLTLGVQGHGDLGARMTRAMSRTLARHPRVLLIGTDAPMLGPARLSEAALALRQHDAVFVPALDGGYALVGLRRPAHALFEGMRWSTAEVMAQTRTRAKAAGLHWVELEPVMDIDEPADLAHLPAGWLP
ncbi:TIGR04282 family arsenosugar biosynthesis glycosyltransferase [Cupriavidus sp. CP313]